MRVTVSALARADVSGAIDHYLYEAGDERAAAFITALEAAYKLLQANPGAGSLRYAELLGRGDLRLWSLRRFPYLIFYDHANSTVNIHRVIHASRDVPGIRDE